MSSHIIDSEQYGHLWSTEATRELFSDRGRLRGWLEILVALAEAQAECGLVPGEAAEAIARTLPDLELDPAAVGRATQEAGHSTLGLIRCLQAELPLQAREWIYYGATVQDLTDTWLGIVMRRMCGMLGEGVNEIEAAAVALARRHRDTVTLGRTHAQPGLPITFGFKAAVWVAELRRHSERVTEATPRLAVGQLAGAVGSGAFFGERTIELQERFLGRLGLRVPEIAWLTARDRVTELMVLCAMVTGTLAKVGNEIKQLQRAEIGEVREPTRDGLVGSITMPHKRNPELSEHLGTLARVVRGGASLALEGGAHEHERDGTAWKTEWAFVPEGCSATAVALGLAAELLSGLEVDAERMRANLEAQRGYVLSEPVMAVIADKVGKHEAHRLVYEASIAAVRRGDTFAEAIRGSDASAHLDEDELAAALDPERTAAHAASFVDRVLGVSVTG
ncbi:MAG: adenylosuccinate lyase family protein [Solirubrobacterales bacterium]|nr:adenylosuccinate lyase family protein [Solirubrobacterales bacterium]